MSMNRSWLTRFAVAGFSLAVLSLVPGASYAQTCGGEGQNLCGIFTGSPACQPNLIDHGGKCWHPDCGRDGQRPCTAIPLERIPSCDRGLIELPGVCGVKGACGDEGQRACLALVERIPSCNSRNLKEENGRCVHPACGRLGQRPCTAIPLERIPSCDDNLIEAFGQCAERGVCGADGQRACLAVERIPSCNTTDLAEVAGKCQRRAAPPGGPHASCGLLGERACRMNERLPSCDPGLTEVPGCLGDCQGSSGMCANLRLPMTEPTTNWTPSPPVPGADPLQGFADIHVHMFSHLAFGGAVIAGTPFDKTEGVKRALAPDFGTNLDVISIAATPIPVRFCPPLIPNCGRNVLHGDHVVIPGIVGVDDSMGNGTHDGTRGNFGAPIFNAWPTWHATTHQQVYFKWLERAWRGGMRVMTMLAVNNEVACSLSKRVRGSECTKSMPGVDAQLDAAVDFENWLDAQSGGKGKGWFRIAKSAEDAEAIIRDGKLAVVLGIEADTLFNCKQKTCDTSVIASEVDRYFADKFVRVIYPVHDFDGGFGGTAVWMDDLNSANGMIEDGPKYVVGACPTPDISDFVLAGQKQTGCNVKGLTAAGVLLINKLMEKGMIIDIDHMSARSIDQTIGIALAHGKYPLVAGHALFGELYSKSHKRHERMRTAAQLEALRQLGGLVSVMTQDDEGVDDAVCKHSSRSFGQMLKYASDRVGPVAFGSDFNGMAPHVGPRYGDDACGKNAAQKAAEAPKPRLQYPFSLPGFGTFHNQVTGQRTFDFNTDGFAHIGLYPDLIADLAQQGADIKPLMKSAAAYVTMWKKAEHPALRGPVGSTPPPPPPPPPPPKPSPKPLPRGIPTVMTR